MRTILLVMVGLLAAVPGASADPCDPNAKTLEQIRTLRLRGDTANAARLTDKVLQSSPDDFRANYDKGLILIDESRLDRPGKPDLARAKQGIAVLETTAAMLPKLDQACAKKGGWYGILNTIGVEYYNIGDLKNSEKYLTLAAGKTDMLTDDTKRRLYSNLGLLYFAKKDGARSADNFKSAVAAGDASASAKLTQVRARFGAIAQ